MAERLITIPYAPRGAFKPFHDRLSRFSCIVAHRRAGKTVAAVIDLFRAAIRCDKPDPRFAYIAPYYAQSKDVAWGYLKQYTAVIPGVTTNESELRVDLPNGGRVRLYGADNYDRMRGIYLDGVVLDEYADMNPLAWSEVIRPALSDRLGWAAFIGTPKGKNAFYDLYEKACADDDWFALRLKASETNLIPQGELDALRKELSEDEYDREFETNFNAAVRGAYYAALLNAAENDKPSRITKVPVDPYLPVHAAFDLGIGDATAVWLAQFQGREIRLVDYVENSGVALSWYGAKLRELGHTYAPLILPHDAQARELGTGKSRVEMLEAMGFQTRVLPATSIEDGIETARRYLPRSWFDADKCKPGIEALRLYQTKYDDKRGISLGPLHNWTSHAADAFRYLMVAYEEPQVKRAASRDRYQGAGGWLG